MSEGFLNKYGFRTKAELHDLPLELFCYRWHSIIKELQSKTRRQDHFRNIVNLLWGTNNKNKHFQWNPWAERMLEVTHRHPITDAEFPHAGLSGCASSGKSDYLAIYAIVNWMCDPLKTLVMVTSTDLQASRKRIWGAILEYWMFCPIAPPGKLVDSKGLIVTISPGNEKMSDKTGISLIAAERKKEKEAVGKIIGAKQQRVIFIADELPELSEAITEAAFGNLTANPFFQFLAAGNFKSWYDAFGMFIKPRSGNLDEVTEEVDGYETEKGWCQIFDGMKSPNVLGGKDEWKGIYGSKQLKSHRADFGENSATFWRMCRSRPTPVGLDNTIYSESDFIAARIDDHPVWRTGFITVSSLDPSFTNGGDRAVQWFGSFGQDINGVWVLDLDPNYVLLREDVRIRDRTRDFQIADQFRFNCEKRGVLPENAALDSTGAGAPFASIVEEIWSRNILKVDFSGKPSELQVFAGSAKTAQELYDRRVTELWYVGKEFLKSRQLRGMPVDLLREMKARIYDTVKGAEGVKVKVETKVDMKKRLNFSPDLADSFFVMLELLRVRHNFLAGGSAGGFAQASKDWDQQLKAVNQIYSTVNYSHQEAA